MSYLGIRPAVSKQCVRTLKHKKLNLLYLSEANLKDNFFIRDWVHNFKLPGKSILVHHSFAGTVSDTKFVNKRISALLSETLVYNNAFGGDQRGFIQEQDEGFGVNKDLIEKLLAPIQLLILAPTIIRAGEVQLLDPIAMLHTLREALDIEQLTLFSAHAKSPLNQSKPLITSEQERDQYLALYEEERQTIELAYALRPAFIASPLNYAQ